MVCSCAQAHAVSAWYIVVYRMHALRKCQTKNSAAAQNEAQEKQEP